MNYFFKTHKASHIFSGLFFFKGEGLHNSFKLHIRENHLQKHMIFKHIMKNLTKIQSAGQLISHLYFFAGWSLFFANKNVCILCTYHVVMFMCVFI